VVNIFSYLSLVTKFFNAYH